MGRGNFNNLTKFCKRMSKQNFRATLEEYGKQGVAALKASTPKDTGATADAWSYEIEQTPESINLYWTNTQSTKTGVPIVILLRWGHGTGNGGYVQGREFITPAIEPLFNEFLNSTWKEVVSS